MASLRERLREIIPRRVEEVRELLEQHGTDVVSQVTLRQVYGGMRGVLGLVCDTSEVPPDRGLMIRDTPINILKNRLPEEIFWLLCTGELPDRSDLYTVRTNLRNRTDVPRYVWEVLEAMPNESHPMCMLSTALLCMERESEFRVRYTDGMKKDDYWGPTLEDCFDIIAKVPVIAAGIYRMRYQKGPRIPVDPELDWATNFAQMLGLEDTGEDFAQLMCLYMVLHSDHEGGNVSAHTCACVASALSDPYYAISAGLSGLAGPLHGLANQEALHYVLMIRDTFGGVPSDEELKNFVWETLNEGKVIPGYGHAVLRITDPRFEAFYDFGQKHCPDSEAFQIVTKLFQTVPGILREHGKANNPWPNVDAVSGSLLYHYGLVEFQFYTVLFAVSRVLGMAAQMILARGLNLPLERPKSMTTAKYRELVSKQK